MPALAAPAPQTSAAFEVCDDYGHCENFERPVARVIALYGAFNEMLLALDAGDLIVARAQADADIPEIAGLPAIGTHMRPNLELVMAQKPDLILQMGGRAEAGIPLARMAELGAKTLCFDIKSFNDLFEMMRKLGKIAGKEEKAAALIKEWRARLAAIAPAQGEKRPTVYHEARQPALLAAGKESVIDDIITTAGGENIIKTPKKLVRYNEEALLAANPEFCVVQKGPMNPQPLPPDKRPNLSSLACVKNGNILIVDEREFARPGPGSVKAAETLARWLKTAR